MKINIGITFLAFLTTFNLGAQPVQTSQHIAVDQQIIKFMKLWNITGGAVAITKDGKTIYNKGFGYSDQNKTKKAKADDLYRIASVSKPITSIGIMKLLENGQLSLTDKVFGKGNILDQPYYLQVITDHRIYDITIQHLLEHTGGWDRNVPYGDYSHSDPAFFPLLVTSTLSEPNPVGDSTLIKFMLKKGLDNNPGANYSYSNVGYLVLGKVIEKITGMKYAAYIEKAVLKPAGIINIQLGKNLLASRHIRETEYSSTSTTLSCYGDGTRVPWQYGGFNIEAMNAHGGWIASASDLTKLLLSVDGLATSPDILNGTTIKAMTAPGNVNKGYAKGWCVNSKNTWWHTGSMDGTSSFVCRTTDGYTWAFLFNSRGTNSDTFWQEFDRLPWNCLKTMSTAVA
ncbi:MAG: beta-lactamase family protein, partial [Bacteroidetes bacterium]|nr:beta-lactamase family protein [Bacteroidota bacterium]